jgi:hypothetical protein
MSTSPGADGADEATRPAGHDQKSSSTLRNRWSRSMTVLRAPRVTIEMYGGDQARAVFDAYTRPHPRFKVTAAKRWGVALLRLPDTFDGYLSTSRALRKNRRHAERSGYRYALVQPLEHLHEIVDINRSAPLRQGRPMPLVDLEWATRTIGAWDEIHAVLDPEGRLCAYATVHRLGDAFAFSSLIGHADHLRNGVMYLLVSEAVRTCIERRQADGSPMWLMADTFWGASDGLAYFKERAGFHPYTVRWVWVDRDVP